jgi:hypothetical protein
MKQREPSPDIYRVVYRAGRWKSKSTKYFTAFTTDETIQDFCYSVSTGRAHSDRFTILKVERYDRFADRWGNIIKELSARVVMPDNITLKGTKTNT